MKLTIIKRLLILLNFIPVLCFSNNNILIGEKAPNWALKTSQGKFEFLNNYAAPIDKGLRGNDDKTQERNVVVMSFFATWCQPCIKEIRELHKLKENYVGKSAQFFLIDLTEFFRKGKERKYNKAKKADEFLNELDLSDITILEDNRGIVAKKYDVNTLPRLFVIDKYQIVQMDEGGLCPTCIQDMLTPVLDKLINE